MRRAACMVIASRRRDTGELVYCGIASPQKRPGWGLPGGKVDRGESFFTGAVRETEEETGYLVVDAEPRLIYAGPAGDDSPFVVNTYFAGIMTGAMRSSSEGKVAWITRRQLLSGAYAHYNRKVFDAMKRLGLIGVVTQRLGFRI